MARGFNKKTGPHQPAHVWTREVMGVPARVADLALPVRSLDYMWSGGMAECWEDIRIERHVEVNLFAN
jgi:hypothetical protein